MASSLFASEGKIKVYFGGPLFSIQELIGNEIFAKTINKVSEDRYEIVTPQRLLRREENQKAIRNSDLYELLSCDIALFNFNGEELDSGTVVEFMFAKFSDMPAVVLRTDYRDIDPKCETWNLMAKYYPRTETIIVPAIDIFIKNGKDPQKTVNDIAIRVVSALDTAMKLKPTLESAPDKESVNRWIQLLIKS